MITYKYIDYKEDFISVLKQGNYMSSNTLIIFPDRKTKSYVTSGLVRNILDENATFMSIDDIRDRIFLPKQTVLKEAKRILSFYHSLTAEIKKDLGINSYYDSIDIANRYFYYYKTLNECGNSGEFIAQNWQKKELDIFERIKLDYDELLSKYNYEAVDFIEREDLMDLSYIKNFDKVVFIDVVKFPSYYNSIFKKLNKTMEIDIILQLKEGDFDTKQLKITKVSLPNTGTKIKLYRAETKLQELLNLVQIISDSSNIFDIYSPVPERNDFYTVLPSYFSKPTSKVLNDTKLYKIIEIQINIINKKEFISGISGLAFPILELRSAFKNVIFRDYYALELNDLNILEKLIQDDYKYIVEDVESMLYRLKNMDTSNFIFKIKKIFSDLEEIEKIKDVETVHSYLKNQIDLEALKEEEFPDLFDKIYEVLGLMKSNENMALYQGYKKLFPDNLGRDVYKLFLNYMDGIEINSSEHIDKTRKVVKNLDIIRSLTTNKRKNIIAIDISSDILPKNNPDMVFFTEKQRKTLGTETIEDRNIVDRYRFMQAIFSAQNVSFISMKDKENNIDISSYLEELKLSYGVDEINLENENIELEEVDLEFKDRDIVSILRNSLKATAYEKKSNENISLDELSTENDFDLFEKEDSDFINKELRLGYYNYKILSKCSMQYYFDNIAKLEETSLSDEKAISMRQFGIIIHKSMENLINNNKEIIVKTNKIEIKREEIEEELRQGFRRNKLKIAIFLKDYIESVFIPILTKNILDYFNGINQEFYNKKIKLIQSEKSNSEKSYLEENLSVFLTGTADLAIETDEDIRIVDFKTGASTEEQLDFYKEMLYPEADNVEKYIANLWKGENKKITKVNISKESLNETIKEFLKSTAYQYAEKKTYCANCSYINICDGVKNNA